MNKIVDLHRLDGEDLTAWKIRCCLAKKRKETDMDWVEIRDMLGLDMTPDQLRKIAVGYEEFDRYINENPATDEDEYFKKLQLERDSVRKERMKLQTANIEKNRLDRNEARQEMYYEYVASTINTLPLPEFHPLMVPADSEEKKMEYLLTIADLHYGSTFVSENNEYSPEIFKDRLVYLTERVYDFINEHRLKKIKIVDLGDDIQGILRMSDLRINDSTVVKAVVEVSRYLAMFLNELSAFVEIDYYHVPSANHSQLRPLGSKASEIADEDLEYIIGNYIKDLCQNNTRVHVHLAEEGKQYIEIPIMDYEVLAMHGHTIKNVQESLKNLSMQTRRFIDNLFLGHFHSGIQMTAGESCCNDTEVIVCPSFIGSDPYSDSLMKGSKAAAMIYGFDEIFGRTTSEKIILN